MATPFAARAAKTAAEALFKPDAGTIAERMAGIRERADQEVAKARETAAKAKAAKDDDSASARRLGRYTPPGRVAEWQTRRP